MAVRNIVNYDSQTGVTATSDSFVLVGSKDTNVACILTAGTPVTGARVQVTLDDADKVVAGTAQWVNSPLGNRTSSGIENVMHPVTAVRVSVTDGTWTVQVRQG